MKQKNKYKIIGGDESSCWGPPFGPLIAEEECEVVSESTEGYLLLRLIEPFHYSHEVVEYFVVSPRYTRDTLKTIRESGCFVAIGRVLPGKQNEIEKGLSKDNTEYIAIGLCQPVRA